MLKETLLNLSVMVTVTEAFVFWPLLEDRGCIIEQIGVFSSVHIQT